MLLKKLVPQPPAGHNCAFASLSPHCTAFLLSLYFALFYFRVRNAQCFLEITPQSVPDPGLQCAVPIFPFCSKYCKCFFPFFFSWSNLCSLQTNNKPTWVGLESYALIESTVKTVLASEQLCSKFWCLLISLVSWSRLVPLTMFLPALSIADFPPLRLCSIQVKNWTENWHTFNWIIKSFKTAWPWRQSQAVQPYTLPIVGQRALIFSCHF